MNATTCVLPGGYIDADKQLYRQVQLNPFNGEAEALVAAAPSGPALVSQVLALSIASIGPYQASLDLVRQLLVADRQYLLLKLRAATYGERIGAVLHCPQPACGNKMDIDFTVDDVPVTSVDPVQATYQVELTQDLAAGAGDDTVKHGRTVVFRLPNGSDQEALAPLLADQRDEEAAVLLLQRCIQRIGAATTPAPAWIEALSAAERAAIEQAMVQAAPRVELTMAGVCPECRQAFAIPFDLESFILQELHTSLDVLTREVHYLAYHYHWGEREIMAMPRVRRRRYIEVLADELEKLRYAA
jgi:hypothetical protein